MIISALLLRRLTFRKNQLQSLSFPLDKWGRYEFDKQTVSTYTCSRLSEVSENIPGYRQCMFFESDNDVATMFWLIPSIAFLALQCWFYNSLGVTVENALAFSFLGNWLAWEVWSLFNIQRLHMFNTYRGEEIRFKMRDILVDEQYDRRLVKNTKVLVEEFIAHLQNTPTTLDEADLVAPGDLADWKIANVQFHTVDNDPTARDVTLVVASADTSKVVVLPCLATIENWLKQQLGETRAAVKTGTHTDRYLERLSVQGILGSGDLQPKNQVLQLMATLATEVHRPYEARTSLELYGLPWEEGQVLLLGINLRNGDGQSAVHTDTYPVIALKRSLEKHIAANTNAVGAIAA